MTTDSDGQQSPFTRPGFVAAAVVVALVVVLGIVLAIVNATHKDEPGAAGPSATASTAAATPSSAASGDAADESVCGLTGVTLSGSLTTAPETVWQYQGVTAFPTSSTFGPGEGTATTVRSCYQHSPSGALFAAANGLVLGTDPELGQAWFGQFVAEGPHRDDILAANTAASGQTSDTRLAIAGFRLLSYEGSTARVDVAVNGSSRGTGVVGSFVYDLVWQAGDWKLSAETATPFSYATIPDLSGYVSWKG